MKSTLFLFLILLFNFQSKAQNQRFIYQYTFKPDSLNTQNIIKEIMNLDVTKEGSHFYSNLLLDRDSLFFSQFEKGKNSGTINIDLRKVKNSQANFIISKKYPTYDKTFHTSFNAINLAIKDDNIINWTILPETKKIEGYNVQKAITNFAKRNWIAWFTNDIQLQDGPYKFCGLPGLILNIEDEKEEHIFNIVGIKKQYSRTFNNYSKSNEIYVSEKKFNQLWNEYKKDPAKNIKIIHGSSAMSESILFNSNTGKQMTKEELIKNKEEGSKKYFEQNNNFIERNLYK